MKFNVGIILWALIATTAYSQQPQYLSTSELASKCRVSINITDGVIPAVSALQFQSGAFCDGYFLGFASGIQIMKYMNDSMTSRVCLPGNSEVGQWERVFLKYIDQHPEELHLPMTIVVWSSLAEAFPCK